MVFAPLAQVARLFWCQGSLASQILGTCEVRLRLRSGEGFQLSGSIQVQPFKGTYICPPKRKENCSFHIFLHARDPSSHHPKIPF